MFKKEILFTIIVLLAGLFLAVSGCSTDSNNGLADITEPTENDQYGGSLIVAGIQGLASLDPLTGTAGSEYIYLYPIYDSLIDFDEDLNLIPGLAEDWEVVDSTTIRLFIRKGVKFHDGTALDAEAVKFNIERSKSEISRVPDLAVVESVEVLDEYTLDLILSSPNATVLAVLTDRAGMMVSPDAVEKYGEDFSLNPVGTGPFVFQEWAPNSHVQYSKFDDYWQEGKPYLDQLTLKIVPSDQTRVAGLKTGEIDFLWAVPPQHAEELKTDDNIEVQVRSSLFTIVLGMNVSRAPLDDVRVRQAINVAIDKEAILKEVMLGYGSVTNQLFPTGFWAYNDTIKHIYDPDLARQILTDAGYDDIEMTIITGGPGGGADDRIFEIIASQLNDVGINTKVEIRDMVQAVTDYVQGQVDVLGVAWSGRPDPQMTLNALFRAESPYNPGRWSHPEVNSLLDSAQAEYDVDKRKNIYDELTPIIAEEVPFIIIYNADLVNIHRADVKGYVQSFLGRPKFTDIWLDR